MHSDMRYEKGLAPMLSIGAKHIFMCSTIGFAYAIHL